MRCLGKNVPGYACQGVVATGRWMRSMPRWRSVNGDKTIERFDYNSEDGPSQKATIEHVFGAMLGEPTEGKQTEGGPWQMSWQMSERNLVWNDDLKLRLIKRIASDELGVSEHEMDWRLSQLAVLLPGLESRLVAAPPKLVARLAAQTSKVAERVLQLKTIFPTADISVMLNNRLTLLLDDDMAAVQEASEKLRIRLPEIHVDRFVQAFPVVLDYETFEMALQDIKRIMPSSDITQLLRNDPYVILSLVKGQQALDSILQGAYGRTVGQNVHPA